MPRWLLYTLLTMLLWGGWGFVSKPLSTSLSPWQVQCLSTLGLIPVLAALTFSGGIRSGSDRRRGFLLAFGSGIIASAGNVAYYQALAAGGKAAAVTPLTSVYPLVTIVLALIVLRERINGMQIGGIVLSLLALLCFNVGGPDEVFFTPWLTVALIPIALWGVSALLQKMATAHASAELATFAFLLGFVPVALVAPLFDTISLAHAPRTWGLVFLVGFLFALGNYTLIFAYGSGGRAAVVTPMASLYSLVTIPLAILLLGERIGAREGVGIALAVLAVVALAWETPPPSEQGFDVGAPERPEVATSRQAQS